MPVRSGQRSKAEQNGSRRGDATMEAIGLSVFVDDALTLVTAHEGTDHAHLDTNASHDEALAVAR